MPPPGMGDNYIADIITYVGVPLAVLGVLPTLYTCIKSLLTLREIRKQLDRNGVSAITRSSLLSGIVEVEIQRHSITPLERADPQYFEPNQRASSLDGGSWTQFNWRTMPIGMKQYRFQYHDELKQPQAEVQFEALIAFLLDHGAVPSVAGFSDLRSSGLWTPIGTSLLTAPHSTDPVLQVAKSDDSDGILSLSLHWNPRWNQRDADSVPPYWIRIRPPPRPLKLNQADGDTVEPRSGTANVQEVVRDDDLKEPRSIARNDTEKTMTNVDMLSDVDTKGKRLSDPTDTTAHVPQSRAYRLRIGTGGVQSAYCESDSATPLRLIRLTENRRNSVAMPNTGDPVNIWFCCAITALAAPRGGLWSFAIPPDVLALSQRESIPSGVMVLLGILVEDAVPKWRSITQAELAAEDAEERQWELMERGRRQVEISRMPFELQAAERAKDMQAQSWKFHEKARERRLREQKRRDREVDEALASWRVGVGVVIEGCRSWLVEHTNLDKDVTVAEVVELWVYSMVESEGGVDAGVANKEAGPRPDKVVEALEEWKGWSESGGMLRPNYEKAKDDVWAFCVAACIVSLIKDTAGRSEGNVVSDLQECLRIWKKVRLG